MRQGVGMRREQKVVLVVDDEALIRMNTVEMVEEAGFLAIEARDAEAAIEILTERDDIAILLTDVTMPGRMDGLKLADFVEQTWPSIRIILASGLRIVRDRELPRASRFLPKPYTSRQISDALRELAG
jgi:CheY-like chemotaxis protein